MLYKQNQIRPFELAKKVEQVVLDLLILQHAIHRAEGATSEDDYAIGMAVLYRLVAEQIDADASRSVSLGGAILTTGFFNRVIGDMKKVRLIGTAKGGEIVFLTKEARELNEARIAKMVEKEKQSTSQTEVRQ